MGRAGRALMLVVGLVAGSAAASATVLPPEMIGRGAPTSVHPACRAAHEARLADHDRRVATVRGEMGANEAALAASRDGAEIAKRLEKRTALRHRLAKLEADRRFVERRSRALLRICVREAEAARAGARERCRSHGPESPRHCRAR